MIVLTHGGADRLLEVISTLENVEVAGVFVESKIEPERTGMEKIRRSIRYDGLAATLRKSVEKLVGRQTSNHIAALRDGQSSLEKLAGELGIRFYTVDSFHSPDGIELIRSVNADLGILYGTNIIKESVFALPRLGSINLHQGLAPLYRGGPTVFWELFNGEKEIGITVHFVAKKVDTGDIILQTTVPLEYDFSRYGLDYESFLEDFRPTLKEPSVQMMVEAVRLISEGNERRIKQDTTLGKRYRLPTKREKDQLRRILKSRMKTGASGVAGRTAPPSVAEGR